MHQRLLGSQPTARSLCAWGSIPALSPAVSACTGITHAFASVQSVICSCVPASTGIMLGRMGDSGAPLVSFCQCLNESVMKIVAVAVW